MTAAGVLLLRLARPQQAPDAARHCSESDRLASILDGTRPRTLVLLLAAVTGYRAAMSPAWPEGKDYALDGEALAFFRTTTTTTGTENPDLGYAALGFGFLAILVIVLFIRRSRRSASATAPDRR